jgi:Beta-ketoacyl synthase, N-terminal domain
MRMAVPVVDVAAFAARLPGSERIRMTRCGSPVSLPAFSSDPRARAGVPATLRRRIDRFTAVAYLAITDVLGALPADQRPARDRVGLFLANTRAGWSYGEPELRALVEQGMDAMHAYQATAWFPAAAQGEVSIGLDLRGCSKTAAGRESGFAEALWLARDALERDAVELAVVGAAESLASDFALCDWSPDEPLPAGGAAEGAAAFAIRRRIPAGQRAIASLRDLRFSPPDTSAEETDWVPTLSAATRLLTAVERPGSGKSVRLGGGFSITVDTHESAHRMSTHAEHSGDKRDRAHPNLPVLARGRRGRHPEFL